jgi:hypothetical protein
VDRVSLLLQIIVFPQTMRYLREKTFKMTKYLNRGDHKTQEIYLPVLLKSLHVTFHLPNTDMEQGMEALSSGLFVEAVQINPLMVFL